MRAERTNTPGATTPQGMAPVTAPEDGTGSGMRSGSGSGTEMSSRERVLAVIRGERSDRVPFDIWYTPEVRDQLMEYCGAADEPELWDHLEIDKIVMLQAPYGENPAVDGNGSGTYSEERRLEWGNRVRYVATASGAVYEETVQYPMAGFSTVKEIAEYSWPDPDRYRYDELLWSCNRFHSQVRMLTFVSLFEIYCRLRPLDQALVDLYIEQELAATIIGRILEIQKEYIRRGFDMCGELIDIVYLSDDMGMQDRQLISTEKWEAMFAGPYRELIDAIHARGAYVFYHSDGAAFPIITRMAALGADIINPIQHVCPGMEREHLIDTLGDSVVFHGAVDNQRVLPLGTADDVRREAAENIGILGSRGRYICAPCHNLQPGTPVENIIALYRSNREWISSR